MVQKKWVYTLELRHVKINEAHGNDLICYKCRVQLKIGDEVYSRNSSSSKSKGKHYHQECAKLVNIL